MPFATTYMYLEIIILSEVKSDRERQIYHLYVESKKTKRYKWTYIQNRNRPTDIEKNLRLPKWKVDGEG